MDKFEVSFKVEESYGRSYKCTASSPTLGLMVGSGSSREVAAKRALDLLMKELPIEVIEYTHMATSGSTNGQKFILLTFIGKKMNGDEEWYVKYESGKVGKENLRYCVMLPKGTKK